MTPFALLSVLLLVEEPVGDVERTRVGNDGLDRFNFFFGQFTSAALQELMTGEFFC